MNTLARICLILFLLLNVAPSAWHAAPATAASSTDGPALPAAAQAAGATSTWWATVQADMARAVPGVDPAGLSPTPNWTRFGDQAGAQMGRAATGAGDVNGDGFDDLLVGAEWYDNGEVDEGRAYLFYGSPTGLATQPAWTAESNVAGAGFGACATTAGDVNGGGYSDVLAIAPGYDAVQTDEGKVFLFHGAPSIPSRR